MLHIPVPHVTILNGSRVTSVVHPGTGRKSTHGLGAVGDPIVPYLDHRSEGFMLEIPSGSATPPVWFVHTRAEPLASGRLPSQRVPWADLGAADFDPFGDAEEGS